MKPMQNYLLNDRPFTIAQTLAKDLSFTPDQPIVFDLSHLMTLDLIGDGSSAYLQGQVSCDVRDVTTHQMRPGALCNLQGRILALLDVILWKGMHLILPQDLLDITQHNLSKSAMFSRVNLQKNPDIIYLGLYIPNKKIVGDLGSNLPDSAWQVKQNDDFCCFALSDTLFILMLHVTQKENFITTHAFLQPKGTIAWHYLELQISRIQIYPNTRGLFLPHRLGLQHTAYLNFNKGCYKGQEIIARTHYRAKIKHNLQAFEVATTEPIFSGQKIYDMTQKSEIGEIIDYCPLGQEQYFIIVSILLEHNNNVFIEHHQQNLILEPHQALFPVA